MRGDLEASRCGVESTRWRANDPGAADGGEGCITLVSVRDGAVDHSGGRDIRRRRPHPSRGVVMAHTVLRRHETERLRAVVTKNGRVRGVFVYQRDDVAGERPLGSDTGDPASDRVQRVITAQLPDDLRDEGRRLLTELGAAIHAEAVRASAAPDAAADDASISDDAIALEFTRRHAHEIRYVVNWGWMHFTGARWVRDEKKLVFDRIRAICREIAESREKAHEREWLRSAAKVAAVERLAQSDPGHAMSPDQFDAQPWLLNTPGGTVELKSGKLRAHRAEDYLTRCTAVAPEGKCPRFLEHVRWMSCEDPELVAFHQQFAGYAITGTVREQKCYFGHGAGHNGKGVFVHTIQHALGDYAVDAPMDMFTESRVDRHPTELALLRGARLVVAQETEKGRAWNESRIKQLTGGDPITARYMRQDFFTFPPSHKLMFFGNHRPSLRSVDKAIRRRMLLVPFRATVADGKVDEKLEDTLRNEWPGVLQWLIDGCLQWLAAGRLVIPAAVSGATDSYLETEDTLGQWLDEQCVRSPAHECEGKTCKHDCPWTGTTPLYESWSRFAVRNGQKPGTMKAFVGELETRGVVRGADPRKSKVMGFYGITLLPRAPDDADQEEGPPIW